MELTVLIAEPLDVLRAGLKVLFTEDPRVSNVYEAANGPSLATQLHHRHLDLIVVNQALITDITLLPEGKFVVLSNDLDIKILKAAYKHGALGYLSSKVSAELLRTMLRPIEKSFLIEPTLVPWIMEHIFGNTYAAIREELLTPREKEIVGLLRDGHNRPNIAKQLCITDATLKTHIKNIARKRAV